jgi:dihydroflavonol-4-reductase
MGDRFLVTGATGLVGNNVVRLLLSQGHVVRVLVREHSDPRPLADLPVDVMQGDIRDPSSVRAACQDVRHVIHAAGYVQLGRSHLDAHQAINVEGSRIVAQQTRTAGARMIHVSSCDAVGVRSLQEPADEDTPLAKPVPCNYVISKRAAEQVVLQEHAEGLDVVIVNPAFMLGPWDWKPSSGRMLLEVARGRGLFAPRGHVSVCDVRDVAAGILAAAQRGRSGCRYILAGQTFSYLDAWRLFARVTGGRRPWFCPGPVVLWVAGRAGDLVTRLTGNEPDVNSGALALARLPKHYSSQRARDELGYQTRPVEQTVQDTWNWFQQYGYVR